MVEGRGGRRARGGEGCGEGWLGRVEIPEGNERQRMRWKKKEQKEEEEKEENYDNNDNRNTKTRKEKDALVSYLNKRNKGEET